MELAPATQIKYEMKNMVAKREEIRGGAMWYYNLSPKRPVNVRYMLLMKEEVDGAALKRAVDVTMTRYPYLKKRIVVYKESYCLEDNPLPVVVLNTPKTVTLCGKEANYHQIAITYFGKAIYLSNTHSIYDGRGRGPFLHTLMYYYCKFRYNEEVDMPGVQTVESPIDPAEWFDPFKLPLPEVKLKIDIPAAPSEVMHLSDMGLVTPSEFHVHHLRLDEKALMAKCKANDATPNTEIALLMARAIAKVHPDSTAPIVAGVYCDVRKPLGAEKSHQPLVTTLSLEYKSEMRNLPISEQNTIFRGMIMLQSDSSALLEGQKAMAGAVDAILSQPTLEKKLEVGQATLASVMKSHTFLVSYSGKGSFGSCDKHIAAAFPQVSAKGMNILMEVTSADGWFFITFIQEWREDVYFNAFMKEIVAQGLDFDLLYSAHNEQPGFSLK